MSNTQHTKSARAVQAKAKRQYSDWFTPEGRRMAKAMAKHNGWTISEYLERLVRRDHQRVLKGVRS